MVIMSTPDSDFEKSLWNLCSKCFVILQQNNYVKGVSYTCMCLTASGLSRDSLVMETNIVVAGCHNESGFFRFGEKPLKALEIFVELNVVHPLALVEYVTCQMEEIPV